jgi:hypothetical protein
MADRTAYWKSRNERVKREKAEAKAAASANTCYLSLHHCFGLTDEEVLAAYAERHIEPRRLRLLDNSPLDVGDGVEKPWTPEMQAADAIQQTEDHRYNLRVTLFCEGVAAYVATLQESDVLEKLVAFDPDEWLDKSTRYTQLAVLRRELCEWLELEGGLWSPRNRRHWLKVEQKEKS